MKAQAVNIGPADNTLPTLSPEALAATAARYSRSDEGLEVLADKTQRLGVDKIFSFIDYGHRSIADMVPVAIFMDKVSIWLAYYLWSECPRASGQETSTRYCKFDLSGVLPFEKTGMPEDTREDWERFITNSFDAYEAATKYWSKRYDPDNPSAKVTLPSKESRLRRNWVFDRARYHLPAAALTNVMMLMSARDWAELISKLLSYPLPEPQELGALLRVELEKVAPSMVRHARATEDRIEGWKHDDKTRFQCVNNYSVECCRPGAHLIGHKKQALNHHPHRYSWVGKELQLYHIIYRIPRLAFAEMRDLNRHRTGYKFTDMVPVGFFDGQESIDVDSHFRDCPEYGGEVAAFQKRHRRHPWHVYWSLLGTEYAWEHGATLDKVIYEIELRTGAGAHFRYVQHMTKVHDLLVEQLPWLEGKIILGQGAPE